MRKDGEIRKSEQLFREMLERLVIEIERELGDEEE